MRPTRNRCGRGFFLLALLLATQAWGLEPSPPDPLWFACEADKDCEPIQADSCGCARGGLPGAEEDEPGEAHALPR